MRQQLVSWLGDAHAMEVQATQRLENQARRIASYPDLQKRIREHLDETRAQLEKVERCIERYDGCPPGSRTPARC